MAIAVAMVSLFAVSYSLALGRPTPHHIPAQYLGRLSFQPAVVAGLERETENGLQLTRADSLAAAERAVEEQRDYAVLALAPTGARLFIASAAGTSVARLLTTAAMDTAQAVRQQIPITDLHPLPSTDPEGLVEFYVTLAATILGFVTVFQLRANAPALTLQEWVEAILVLALTGGFVLALVTDPIIGALRGSFVELWAALSAEIAVAASFNAAMLMLVGRWAMVPTWGLFVALGNASSGGAVAPPLLPAFYEFIGRFVPNGATVQIIRNAVYFRSAQHLEPIVVEAAWLVVAFSVFVTVARLRGKTPAKT